MSFFGRLFGSESKEDEETRRLIEEVEALRSKSIFVSDQPRADLSMLVMEDVSVAESESLGTRIGAPVYRLLRELFEAEPIAWKPPKSFRTDGTLSEGFRLREQLRETKRLLEREEFYLDKWANVVGSVLAGMYKDFPEQAFVDPDQDGHFDEGVVLAPSAPLYTFVRDVPGMLSKIISTFFRFVEPGESLYEGLRDQFLIRLCLASGVNPDDRHTTERRLILPGEKRGLPDDELIDLYLTGTPFRALLLTEIPLPIPEAVRFEHTHILAGTGHGKTQALQYLIAGDLARAIEEKRSVVVMDGQGDLLSTLLQSGYFAHQKLQEALIYIDPTDTLRPVGLNLFDIGLDRMAGASAAEHETVLNATIELYEYFFGGLLGAELTQRQGLVFRFLATLMTRIPDANIHTLRELMEDGERFRPYIEKLDGSARAFFETRFFDRGFAETKKQILNRLWGVLSSPSLDRMMSARRNTVDLFQVLQRGSIVFINTARDFFGHEGSTIFSRMFVALLGQALMRRAVVPRHERTPTFIYIDEAEDVVDLTLTRMLAQVRKYKGAITFAHQNLDQLAPEIRAGVIANTSVKLAGGVSAKDARVLADDFRCEPDFLLSQRKEKATTHFACYAKNVTDRAVSLSIPLGYVEGGKRISELDRQRLIETSRMRYGTTPEAPPPAYRPPEARAQVPRPVPPAPPAAPPMQPLSSSVAPQSAAPVSVPLSPVEAMSTPVPPAPIAPPLPLPPVPVPESKSGGGGVKHRYLQSLVKELGEARGFRVGIEEEVHDGAGRVDVLLSRGNLVLAFEISVTTTKDHELGNIEKCLALTEVKHVVMLVSNGKRQRSLAAHVGGALEEGDRKRVSFLLPEDVPGFLDGYQDHGARPEKTVRGYTVRSKVKETAPDEALARRRAVAEVVARSLGGSL